MAPADPIYRPSIGNTTWRIAISPAAFDAICATLSLGSFGRVKLNRPSAQYGPDVTRRRGPAHFSLDTLA
jgi:hypothetical protein